MPDLMSNLRDYPVIVATKYGWEEFPSLDEAADYYAEHDYEHGEVTHWTWGDDDIPDCHRATPVLEIKSAERHANALASERHEDQERRRLG
mgnify:FL=1